MVKNVGQDCINFSSAENVSGDGSRWNLDPVTTQTNVLRLNSSHCAQYTRTSDWLNSSGIHPRQEPRNLIMGTQWFPVLLHQSQGMTNLTMTSALQQLLQQFH